MANKTKSAAVPALRFPRFQQDSGWKLRKLSDLLQERKQRNRDLKFGPGDVLSVSRDYGCINQIEHLGRSYAGVSVNDYHVVQTGDLVYTKSPLKRNPFGIIRENKGKPGIVSTLYAVYKPTDLVCSGYLSQYFARDYNLNSYLQPIVRKGAKNDMKVNNFTVLSGEIPTPTIHEQQKIASFLTSLDEVIAVQDRKVEVSRAYQRGLIQELFPREGEAVPRLRFPEFRDTPAWVPTTLSALAQFQSGSTPSKDNFAFWRGSIPWVSAKDMKRLFLDDTEDHLSDAALQEGARLVPAGTLLMLTRGMTLLKDLPVCVTRRAMSLNQDVKALVPTGETDVRFLAFLILSIKQRVLRMVSIAGHGTGKLNTDDLKALEVLTPVPTEQCRIAELLTALDLQIASEIDKAAALRRHKEGLLQQLFPSVQEVS